jgi:mono/diheme cytochrome c family protein
MERRRQPEPAARGQDSSDTTGSGANRPASDAATVYTIYTGACASCHESSGRSFSAHGIHLAQSKVMAMPHPRNLIHVILDGIQPPVGTPAALMPGFGAVFTDQQIAALAAFLRARFSDQPVWSGVQDEVQKLRR